MMDVKNIASAQIEILKGILSKNKRTEFLIALLQDLAIQGECRRLAAKELGEPKGHSDIFRMLVGADIEKHESAIVEACINAGLGGYYWIERIKSEGGKSNATLYYLTWQEIAPPLTVNSTTDTDCGETINYDHVEESEYWCAGLFKKGLQLVSWKRAILLSVIICPILITLFFFLVAGKSAIEVGAIVLGIFLAATYPVWTLVDTNVYMPIFTLKDNLVFILKTNSHSIREIHLRRISATCPLCGGDILLQDRGSLFKHRLEGRCKENSAGHRYTFDPVDMSGKRLRSEYNP